MSLLLTASNLLERLKQRTATPAPTGLVEPPVTVKETPRQLRDRLRQEIKDRGGKPEEIETITGDCDQQVATQVKNYTAWLAGH
jgi:hypothetical protein